MAAVTVETLTIELHGTQYAFPVLSLVDRRPRKHARKQFCLIRAIEKLTHNVGGTRSAGQIAQLLAECSMEDTILVADKKAVDSGMLTQEELDISMRAT